MLLQLVVFFFFFWVSLHWVYWIEKLGAFNITPKKSCAFNFCCQHVLLVWNRVKVWGGGLILTSLDFQIKAIDSYWHQCTCVCETKFLVYLVNLSFNNLPPPPKKKTCVTCFVIFKESISFNKPPFGWWALWSEMWCKFESFRFN